MNKAFGFIFVVLATFQMTAMSQTTDFGFQGGLNVASLPANGNYDFEFLLFDTLSGGTQLGSTVALNNVAVVNGTFGVRLNFGAQFPGANRYLEIRVRQFGQPTFTTLAPRQLINSTPYAVKSLNAETSANAAQLGGIAAGQYVITTDPRMSNARNPLPGSTSYIQNSTDRQPSSNFNVTGNGTIGGTLSGDVVNSTAQYNIGGQRVLSTVGVGNTFAGLNTGTSGRGNSFFGTSAGAAISTGETNSFYGNVSGTSNTTGDANSFFGAAAGRLNTTGQLNSFFGYRSGESSTTSSDNAFFGAYAGAANTTGSSNSFFGMSAGAANTTGAGNSFFGRNAGDVNTTGSFNSFFGRSSGALNIGGGFNSFFGYGAGQSNTEGDNNSFFGISAGFLNTTGFDNAFFGANAGDSNSTGANNSFFGRNTGAGNTIGGGNSFFGSAAGAANTQGEQNAFFGRRTGESNTSGIQNSFVGYVAGSSNTTGGGNTFLGAGAGNANTIGDFNTIVGISADVGSGNLTFATAIGANAVVSSSNTIQLGRANGADDVIVPGILRVLTLGNAGSTSLCRNNANGIAPCSSSARYKSNIGSFKSGSSLINRLRPVSFNWKDGGMLDLGLTAEEVAGVEPLLVTYDKNGQVEGVKYDRVGVVLINAVKEQQATIEELKTKIETQQETIAALKKIVCLQSADAEVCKPRE